MRRRPCEPRAREPRDRHAPGGPGGRPSVGGRAGAEAGPPTGSPGRPAPTCCSTPTTRSTGIPGAPRRSPRPRPRTSRSSSRSATRRCYWCHVMERECFMDPAIARLLNEKFVCIKVDREERPDVDQVYMTALQAFGQRRLADVDVPDPRRPAVLRRHLLPARRPRRHARASRPSSTASPRPGATQRAEVEKDGRPAHRDRPPLARRRRRGAASPCRATSPTQGRAQLAEQFDPESAASASAPRTPAAPSSPSPSTSSSSSTSTAATGAAKADAGPAAPTRWRWSSRRSTTWPAAASATSSPAATTATRRTATGSSPTSRRCSTTTPSSPRPTCSPSR